MRLGRLIDNVLDFAKIERGMGVYEFAEADVGEVVERAVDLVGRRLADGRDDDRRRHRAGAAAGPARRATRSRSRCMNLIDNAIKYAAERQADRARSSRATDDRDRS